MLYDLNTIKSRGREWRNSFPDARFVGELEVSEQEIKELSPAVWKFVARASWDEDVCAALAVIVVNLAYYHQEEMGEGFRWHVLHKLSGHRTEDVDVWQQEIGEPVLRLLGRYFHAQDIRGPFRYVRPIMLQAGVPFRLANQFAQFFIDLIGYYGLHFTEAEYTACCEESNVQSSWLASFLRVNGWHYCRDIARIIRHLEDGVLAEADIKALLPRFRVTVESINQLMVSHGRVHKRPTCFPKPKLVLDRNNLRLAIEFAEKGLDGPYQWSDGRRIRSARYILKEEDFLGPLSGRIVQPNGRIEFWSIRAWRPSSGSWAIFQVTDYSIETHSKDASGKIRPGRHLVAFTAPFSIPQEQVVEEYGELHIPGCEDLTITVVDCELLPGFEVDGTGFFVSESESECFPTLRFGSSHTWLPHATNVFVRELPELRIDNWTESFADRYLLLHEVGSRPQRIPEELCRSRANFRLRVGLPAHGRVYIEPKGRTPKGFVEAGLSYVVLPEAALAWPTGLHEPDELLTIEIKPPGKFRVDWAENSFESIEWGRWRVPAQLDFVEGQVSYEKEITFNIAGPIHRLRIRGECLQDRILWQDNLRDRTQLFISLSNEEVGGRIALGVADERGFVKCLDLGPVPRNGRLKTSTDSIRDAFQTRALPAGRIAIRLPSARVVKSDEIFLHDGKIQERLFGDAEDEFRVWINSVPDKFRFVLTALREMSSNAVQRFSIEGLMLPEQLREFLFFYQTCASVLDWDLVENELSGVFDHNLRHYLIWYIECKKFIDEDKSLSPEIAQRLIRGRPRTTHPLIKVTNTPNLRWRKEFSRVLRALRKRRSFRDYKRILREWAGHCRLRRWEAASRCEIGRAQGGRDLTSGALNYCHAFEEREASNITKSNEYFLAANPYFESARKVASEGLVWEIASALRVMIFFHTGHNRFSLEADELVQSLSSHWARLKLTLGRLDNRTWDGEADDTLGLSDITPHKRDIELEEALDS